MKMSARGAMKERQDTRRVDNFSKQWESGTTLSAFYPFYWDTDTNSWELLIGAGWGHSVDVKELKSLGRVWIPTNSIIDEETGKPKTPDVLWQFSKIAKLIIQGGKDEEIAKAEQKGKKNMDALQEALKSINEKYDKMSPVVGRLAYKIVTECVTVKMVEDKPDLETVRLVSQDLSDGKIQALYSILNNKSFGFAKEEPTEEERSGEKVRYLEVIYAFGNSGKGKQEDGKVSPTGVPVQDRLESTYPDLWPRIYSVIETLPVTSDTIMRRNNSFHRVEEDEIITALSSYAFQKSEALDNLREKKSVDILVKNFGIIDKLDIPIQNESLLELINKEKEAAIGTAEKVAEAAPSDAPTLASLHAEDVTYAKEHVEEDAAQDIDFGAIAAEGGNIPL